MSTCENSQSDKQQQQQQPAARRSSSIGCSSNSSFYNGSNPSRLSVYPPPTFDCRRSHRQLSATSSVTDLPVDHTDADDVTTAAVLAGNLDNLPPVPSRTVCVFISSTFSDMAPERNALMEQVYPQLKEFCRQQYRLEFQMLDLRWGIREQSHNDHRIIEFCLSEIDKCKAKSVGPNFVALIGQKYGYRPFPPTIAADEFETIREDIASSEDRQVAAAATLLDNWFKKNTNVLPHVYTLQPISSVIPDYAHCDDVTRKQKAEEKWEVVYNQLRQLLRQGVTSCVEKGKLAASCKDRYFVSVTEYEIARGMLSDPVNCNASSLCFMRNINNLERNACHARARNYIDLVAADSTATGPAAAAAGTAAAAAKSSTTVDHEAQQLLTNLREKVTQVLTDERNVEYLEFDWNQDKDCYPSDDEQYLKLFCDSFRDKMQWLISRAAERTTSITSSSSSGGAATSESVTNNTGVASYMQLKFVEVVQHLTMCRDRSREFRGRHAALSHIRHYLQLQQQQRQSNGNSTASSIQDTPQMTADQPIVVYGESGSGKTSVLAKVASLSSQWLRSSATVQPVVVIRFIGTTSQSCNIRLLLSSVCWQIASVYRISTSQLPNDYPSLVTFFHGLLHVATVCRPLVLILDGLDQLNSAHRAQNLAWLPTVLPTSVRLVLSTLQSDKYELLETLKALLTCSSENFVRITPLGVQLSVDVVKDRLQSVNRTLTTAQLAVVERALSECSLPLYASLVFEEVCQWASYQNVAETVLQPTVDDIINTFFDRLELYHGKVFVSHTLSYLTASRNGLSYAELEDILSLDDTVLNDVFQHWLPPLRRIPPLLIPRLLEELGRYLVQREANGARVTYWYHGQFIAVVRRRYLADAEDRRCRIHSTLAHYYLGTWASGRRKPFRYSNRQLRCLSGGRAKGKPRKLDDEADRMVAQQPLYFGQELNYSGLNAGKKQLRYNMRKLSELPYHLIESGMFAELRSHVLFNYDWLHAKLSATSLPDVLADFQMATMSTDLMESRAKDLVNASDIKLLAGALRVGGAHLSHNPDTLAFDLLGRLLFFYADNNDDGGGRTVPTPAVDSDDNDETQVTRRINEETRLLMAAGMKTLLQQCDVRSVRHSALLPVLQCFDPPTAMSLYNLEGHSQVVSDVVFSPATNELISVSKDGTLVFWDLSSGERTRCLDVSAAQPGRTTRLYVADSRFLVVDFDSPDSLAHVYDVKTGRLLHACAQPRLTSPLRGFVAGCLLCRQKSLVDLRTGVELATLDEFIESKSFVVCAVTPDERFLLVGEPTEVRLFDLQQTQTSASAVAPTASTWNEPGTPPMIRENSSGSAGSCVTPGMMCRQKPMVSFSASNQLSAVAISPDSRLAFVGQSFDCVFSVLDIDPLSEDFGQVVIKVDFSQYATLSPIKSAPTTKTTLPLATAVYTDRFDPTEQRRPNEISEISLSSVPCTGAIRVLLNVCRFRLAVLTLSLELTRNYVCCSLDVPADAVTSSVVLQSSSFSHDGQLVLASVDSSLLVWSTDTCQLIHNINLHTTSGYSLSVHSDRNLVATGSTIHTAVMVWDLDKAQTTYTPDLKVYAGPVDCVSVACDVRLIFIKSHYGLASSNRSYRYLGSFGVDVWNLSTGSWTSVLPFRKYGRLLQMSVSPDAELLALLLVNDSQDHYVMVFEIESRSGLQVATRWSVEDIRCVATHARCSFFVVSPTWDFMVTVSTRRRRSSSCPTEDTTTELTSGDVQLWDINTGESVVHFQEATSPVFTLDGSSLLYIDQGLAVIAYSLNDLAPKYRISDCCRQVDQLIALPVFHQRFLSTQLEVTDVTDIKQQCAVVTVYEERALLREMRVAAGGLLDVSKDGQLAVDGLLQVYDLETGTMVASFRSQITSSSVSDSPTVGVALKLVRLTADGRYVVWVDGVEVHVGRVSDELVVARTSTHERVTSLETMEHGYVLVVGRKDGHLLTMRLVVDVPDKDDILQQQQQQRCSDVHDRLQLLLNRQGCSQESLLKLDDTYRQRPKSKSDRQLPVASEYVISNMLRHADVPHSIITTTSTNGTSGSHRGGHDHRRRVASTPDSPWKVNQKSGGSPSSEAATSAAVVSNHLRLPPEIHHHLHSTRSATPSPTTNRRDAITVRAATLSWASRLSPAALRRRPLTRSALTLMDSLRRSESALDSPTLAIATFNSLHKSSTLPPSESYGTMMDEIELSRLTLDGGGGGCVTGADEEVTTGKHRRRPSKKKRFKSLFKLSAAKKCFGCSSSSSESNSNSKPPTGQRK